MVYNCVFYLLLFWSYAKVYIIKHNWDPNLKIGPFHHMCGGKTGKHTRTDSIPEASSRPFIILKYKRKSGCAQYIYIYTDPLCSFTLY